jgi:hypothetical protein
MLVEEIGRLAGETIVAKKHDVLAFIGPRVQQGGPCSNSTNACFLSWRTTGRRSS